MAPAFELNELCGFGESVMKFGMRHRNTAIRIAMHDQRRYLQRLMRRRSVDLRLDRIVSHPLGGLDKGSWDPAKGNWI